MQSQRFHIQACLQKCRFLGAPILLQPDCIDNRIEVHRSIEWNWHLTLHPTKQLSYMLIIETQIKSTATVPVSHLSLLSIRLQPKGCKSIEALTNLYIFLKFCFVHYKYLSDLGFGIRIQCEKQIFARTFFARKNYATKAVRFIFREKITTKI